MACCSDRVDMAHSLDRFLLLNVPTIVYHELAEHLDGNHPNINPITLGELMGLPPHRARHVAKFGEGSSPTIRILNVLQKENVTLGDVYRVLVGMNSSAVQVLKNFWRHGAYQGISRGNQGHHSMDLQTEPSTCGCEGCQNNLSHSSSTQSSHVSQTSNFPPQFNNMDDSTLTNTVATDSERNLRNDLSFIPPEEHESDSDSVSELMNSLEEIGNRNSPSIVEVSNGSPTVQRSQAATTVAEVNVVQAAQQQALETAQRAQNPSPAPTLRPAQPKQQRPKSLSDPYVLVVCGERDWKDNMEAEIQRAILDLLCNNDIPYVICSPNRRWHAQPEDLVNQDDVRRDNDAFRERIFRKARAIIMVITPKVKRYANPSATRDGVRQDVANIVRSMRAEVARPAGNTRVFPVIMAQLGANRKHNFDCLASTITYSFPSHVQQRDFICHLQKKLSQR